MKFVFLTIFIFSFLGVFSQTDSPRYAKLNWTTHNLNTPKKALWKTSILPLSFSVTALFLNTPSLKENIQSSIQAPFNNYSTTVDDYIQFAPIGFLYTADAFKLKAEHSIWNQTKLLVLSELTTAGIIQILKYSFKIERPDKSEANSFPSGHTGQAFVAAQVLHNEFKSTQPLLAYSGYLFAVSTGTLRIVNNRHWLPDVLMSAGIGMLITNLIYHYEPFKNWNPFKTKQTNTSLQLYPSFTDQFTGLNIKLHL